MIVLFNFGDDKIGESEKEIGFGFYSNNLINTI